MLKDTRVIKKFSIFLYGLFIITVSVLSSGVSTQLILFYVYSLSIIYINSKGTLSDPRVLLLGFFTLYSTFYSLLVYLTDFSLLTIDMDLIELSLKYQLFATFVFVTVLNIVIDDKEAKRDMPDFSFHASKITRFSENLIFLVLIPVVLIAISYIYSSGASSKRELLDSGGIINQLALFAFLIMTAIATIRAARIKFLFMYDFRLQIFLFFSLFFMLLSGERDIFFRIAFIALLVFFDKNKKASFPVVILILLIIIFVIPISQAFKAVLLSGDINIGNIGLELILSNEFMSASRNMYSLLLYGVEHDLSYFFNDILRAFTPSVLLDKFDITSTVAWFHNVYRVENGFPGTSGWGFGLVAEGYLIGDIWGIILIMSIYAFTIGKLYNMRYNSIYWYVFYLLTFVTSIYVIRADMANLFSQVFKIGGISVLLLYIAHKVMLKRVYN